MTAARTAAAAAVAAAFRLRGETVSIPVDAVPTDFSAIRSDPAAPAEFGPVRVAAAADLLRFQASEIAPDGDLAAAPLAIGTLITLASGDVVAVQGAPQWGDDMRITVDVDTQPAP